MMKFLKNSKKIVKEKIPKQLQGQLQKSNWKRIQTKTKDEQMTLIKKKNPMRRNLKTIKRKKLLQLVVSPCLEVKICLEEKIPLLPENRRKVLKRR